MILAEAILLLTMGAGLLITGGYGFRLAATEAGKESVESLPAREAILRRRLLRGGSFACLTCGTIVVALAAVLLYAAQMGLHHGYPHSPAP
jgi:hypothetical protein